MFSSELSRANNVVATFRLPQLGSSASSLRQSIGAMLNSIVRDNLRDVQCRFSVQLDGPVVPALQPISAHTSQPVHQEIGSINSSSSVFFFSPQNQKWISARSEAGSVSVTPVKDVACGALSVAAATTAGGVGCRRLSPRSSFTRIQSRLSCISLAELGSQDSSSNTKSTAGLAVSLADQLRGVAGCCPGDQLGLTGRQLERIRRCLAVGSGGGIMSGSASLGGTPPRRSASQLLAGCRGSAQLEDQSSDCLERSASPRISDSLSISRRSSMTRFKQPKLTDLMSIKKKRALSFVKPSLQHSDSRWGLSSSRMAHI